VLLEETKKEDPIKISKRLTINIRIKGEGVQKGGITSTRVNMH